MAQQAVTIAGHESTQVSSPSKRAASEQERTVLRAFLNDVDKPRYGYDLHKETGVDHSTIYNLLLRLLAKGCLEGEWQLEGQGKPKRLYTLTKEGISYAARKIAD